MIFALLIGGGIALIITAFLVLPPLPPTPAVIVSASDTIYDFVANSIGLFAAVLSPPLLIAAFALGFAVMTFEHIYNGVMWILRKIPMLGIS